MRRANRQIFFRPALEKQDNDAIVEAVQKRLKDVAGFEFVPDPLPMQKQGRCLLSVPGFAKGSCKKDHRGNFCKIQVLAFRSQIDLFTYRISQPAPTQAYLLTLFAWRPKHEFVRTLVTAGVRNHRLVRVTFCKGESKRHGIGFFSASPRPASNAPSPSML